MQRKLGIVADCIVGKNPVDTLEKIKAHGFECFFSGAHIYDQKNVAALQEKAQKLGLDYEFIHGPFDNINEMWTSQETPHVFTEMCKAIDSASMFGIKTVIAHVSSGFTPPPVNDLGLFRFDAWVEYAEKKGVILAFENLRKLGNLACLFDRYEDKTQAVRFCYDCGHEHCYTINVPFLEFYGDKLICTHIHDNFGKNEQRVDGGDLHLLPFDGDIDYQKMMRGLNGAKYQGSLMLEVFNTDYQNMTEDEFISSAYERIKKISLL